MRAIAVVKADLTRNRLGTAMFTAWWWSFSRYGVIHGDPHLGNFRRQRIGDGPR
jgi:predicted unusual protein kinase regulating ubiquinone biosynthesis (AarF/ABC1/UbiB family)